MEILGKETTNYLRKKKSVSEFKMFVAIEHKLDNKPVVPFFQMGLKKISES